MGSARESSNLSGVVARAAFCPVGHSGTAPVTRPSTPSLSGAAQQPNAGRRPHCWWADRARRFSFAKHKVCHEACRARLTYATTQTEGLLLRLTRTHTQITAAPRPAAGSKSCRTHLRVLRKMSAEQGHIRRSAEMAVFCFGGHLCAYRAASGCSASASGSLERASPP